MNHIMMFKSPWLSLHHPLIVIVPLHVLVVLSPDTKHNAGCVSYFIDLCPHLHVLARPLDF